MNSFITKTVSISRPLLLATALVSAAVSAATTDDENIKKGLAIATEADKRDTGFGDFTANMVMELRNKQGDVSTRTIRLKTLEVIGDGDTLAAVADNGDSV